MWVTRQLSGFMVRLSSAMFISCSGGNDAADELSPLDLLGYIPSGRSCPRAFIHCRAGGCASRDARSCVGIQSLLLGGSLQMLALVVCHHVRRDILQFTCHAGDICGRGLSATVELARTAHHGSAVRLPSSSAIGCDPLKGSGRGSG